jgi:hypothetical protein
MAIALEFVTVIVRKAAIERVFSGGLDGFARQDLTNLAEDEHLMRVGFMSTSEALEFVTQLEAAGLTYRGQEDDSDIAVIVGSDGPMPPWLSAGAIDGHPACWASSHRPGDIAWPEPGFLLRCPRVAYDSLPEVASRCGAEVQEVRASVEEGAFAKVRCTRGEAEIMIDVIGERLADSPVGLWGGLWGHRQLARRKQYHADVALIHDFMAALVQEGAEGGPALNGP